MSVRGVLSDNAVICEDKSLLEKGYGEDKGDYIVLSPFEALYLVEKGKLTVMAGGAEKTFADLFALFKDKDGKLPQKYFVYKDLRERGYVVKTGYKFGTHFRVYPRGKKPGEAHSKYVVEVLTEEETLQAHQLSRMVRLARAIRTELVLAIVDSEGDVVYYKIERKSL